MAEAQDGLAVSLAAGTRCGAYEVLHLVGAGGMGEVYRAHDDRLGRDVALKVLPESLADDAERLARFEQEARSASSLLLEARQALGIVGEALRQDLEGDVPPEPIVVRPVDLSHPPGPDQVEDLVGSAAGSGSQAHR